MKEAREGPLDALCPSRPDGNKDSVQPLGVDVDAEPPAGFTLRVYPPEKHCFRDERPIAAYVCDTCSRAVLDRQHLAGHSHAWGDG